jgi:short-subunit dehydrogenase
MKRIAIVTGASSGMGKEAVLQISRKYSWLDEIWVIARRKELLEELQAQVKLSLKILAYDLTDDNDVFILKELLKKEKPAIKLLLNAAGFGKIGTFAEGVYEEQAGMININCKALTGVTYICLPYMKRKSRVLQFASSAAFLPQPHFAVYAATKAYVLSFSRALARELKHQGITVTCVCPGPVDTEFFQVAETKEEMADFKKRFLVSKEDVICKALRDASRGREKSVYSLSMNLLQVGSKIIPHKIFLKQT